MEPTYQKGDCVHVALASNEAYFPGLYCAVASVLLSFEKGRNIAFHILDGGITVTSRERLEALVRRLHSGGQIYWLSIDQRLFEMATVGPGQSHMAYARLLLPALVTVPKCVYLDCDIVSYRNIGELYDVPLGPTTVACAVRDCETLTYEEDCPGIAKAYGISPKEPYFNSGVLVLDIETLRREGLLGKALRFFQQWDGKYRYWDQSALNILLHGRICWAESHWNRPSWQFDDQDSNQLDCLLHFTGAAPWLGGRPGPAQVLFEMFAESLGVSIDKKSNTYRRRVRYWKVRGAMAPVRALVLPLAGLLYTLTGRHERAYSTNRAGRYWITYLCTFIERRRRYRERIATLHKLATGVGSHTVSHASPSS